MTRPRTEGGSGSLLVAIGILVAGVALAVVVAVSTGLAAAHRVRAAADLVAVSAAAELADGGQACRIAARIAAANAVVLRECEVRGDLVDFAVTVVVAQRPWAGWLPELTARAHAGRVVGDEPAPGEG